MGVAFKTGFSCAVTFSCGELDLSLESVSSTRMCVGWLTVADVRPGPWTSQEVGCWDREIGRVEVSQGINWEGLCNVVGILLEFALINQAMISPIYHET